MISVIRFCREALDGGEALPLVGHDQRRIIVISGNDDLFRMSVSVRQHSVTTMAVVLSELSNLFILL